MKFRPIHTLTLLLSAALLYACASIGSPDGGPYDETPPKFVRANPGINSTNNKHKKVTIEFDEFIKLEKASEKVVISPPQKEMAKVEANGKRVHVEFFDTLKDNTTYTIDFGDAIVDNNEGNPMGHFAYSFSTGSQIDTMEVSGTVLDAENLEPVKDVQVGLHSNLEDSAFVKLPFDRISRTDSRGRFIIRGIRPGKYRIYALKDGNQNYMFDSKSEIIAYLDSLVIPSVDGIGERFDTIWNDVDTLKYDTIIKSTYTRFLPNNLILRAFKEVNNMQYLVKSERPQLNKFSFFFNAKADTLPTLTGLNFNSDNAFVVEPNLKNDTILYWIKDSLLAEQDTLIMQMDYLATDTLGQLVPKTDTLRLLNKIDQKKRLAMAEEARKKEEKELKKRRKKEGDSIQVEKKPTQFFAMKIDAPSELDLNSNITLEFPEPVESIDTAAFHVSVKVDSLWKEIPFLLRKDTLVHRKYMILSDWQPEKEYQFKVDSMAVKSIYGLHTDKSENTLKVKKLEDYGTLYLNITGAGEHAIVQLLNASDAVIRQQPVTSKKTCDFYFLKPETKYYIRLFNDRNQNGRWDTGCYADKCQPEEVYYFPKVWEMKANFDFEENWDINAVPADKQKLNDIKKQKPEKEKKIQNRNKERAKKLGKAAKRK